MAFTTMGPVLLGLIKINSSSGNWASALSSSTMASMNTSAPTGVTYNLVGKALAPIANLPAIRFANLPAGTYKVEYAGSVSVRNISSANIAKFQFSDGTQLAPEIHTATWGGNAIPNNGIASYVDGVFTYNTPQTNVTFELFGQADGQAGSQVYAHVNTQLVSVLRVWYYPPGSLPG